MDEIMSLILLLNKRETLPRAGLRRNSIYYRLITYINNSICLSLSESYEDVALFINRAEEEIQILLEKESEFAHSSYFSLCNKYMTHLSGYMLKNNLLSEAGAKLIPEKYHVE